MNAKYNPDAAARGIERAFEEMYPTLAHLQKANPLAMGGYEEVLRLAREFRRRTIEPNALDLERKAFHDPAFAATEILEEACKYHFFSMGIPKMFGGQGYSFGAVSLVFEELAAGCLGIANLIGVHYLALCTVAATFDLGKMEEVSRIVVEGEKRGKPALLSTAITEPGAGSDVEDEDEMPKARITSEATPVRGGFRLNGRKVFISNGSLASHHVVIMPTDRKRPVETFSCFLVPSATPGFSVGRIEKKMGQKLCPAAELVFEDCFVPESARVGKGSMPPPTVQLVLGATRGGVGAFGAGVARGAYERALAHALTHEVNGRRMIEEQWVVFKLVDMLRNVMTARAAYLEAGLSNELFGLSSMSSGPALKAFERIVPRPIMESGAMRKAIRSSWVREAMGKKGRAIPREFIRRASAFGDHAKVLGTDLGLENCNIAIDIMGADGLRHDRGMEKCLRDAKLLQIYEGTNQLNRIDISKCLLGEAIGRPAGGE